MDERLCAARPECYIPLNPPSKGDFSGLVRNPVLCGFNKLSCASRERFDAYALCGRPIQNPKSKIQNTLASAISIAAVLVLLGCLPPPCYAGDVSEARAVMAQFDAEIKLALDARAQNDAKAFQEHQNKSDEYLKKAKQIYAEADAAISDDVDILREYGAVLMRSGDFDLAAEVFQRATKRAPGNAALWCEQGRALGALGHARAREAVQALRRAIDTDPNGPDAAETQAFLGGVYRQEGLFDLARECFHKALDLDPNLISARMGLIGLKIQDGDVTEAADDIDKLGALSPEYAAQFPALLAESVQCFQESRLWFPDTAENHISYAKILFRVGRETEALEAAERSASLNPGLHTTWNFVGDLSAQLNRPARAREAYTKSLELKPDQPMTQERLDSLKK